MDLSQLVAATPERAWLYVPAAVALGALHALEPGHSKSVMAAFIVATRGTPRQAALLGLFAAIGHTIVIWALAGLGLWLGERLILDKAEPWLLLATGLLIAALGIRLLRPRGHRHDDRAHGHQEGHAHAHAHGHGHGHEDGCGEDAHAANHRREIEARFGGGGAPSSWDIAWFGFTGGLMPCPAALAVLLVALQAKAFAVGFALVAAFSVGLAIALIAIGVAAAYAGRAATRLSPTLSRWADSAPRLSGLLLIAMGFAIAMRAAYLLSGLGTH